MTENFNHKERRQREVDALKASIMQAARQLATQNGWPEVSIRKIARIIQYTPPVIYEHFKNKEAILIEIEAFGFRQLKYALEEARQKASEPKDQLLAVSERLWDWAFENRELYEVMFNHDGVSSTPPNPKALAESGQTVLEILKNLHLFESQTEELFFNWWALVHGHISLIMSGQVKGMNQKVRTYMVNGIERFAGSL